MADRELPDATQEVAAEEIFTGVRCFPSMDPGLALPIILLRDGGESRFEVRIPGQHADFHQGRGDRGSLSSNIGLHLQPIPRHRQGP